MNYNINFELASFCFAIVLYIYLQKKYYNSNFTNRAFKRLVFFHLISMLFNIAASITISFHNNIPVWINYALNSAFFVAEGILYYTIHLFIISFGIRKKIGRVLLFFSRTILVTFLLLISVNIPTGLFFSFKDGIYVHGPLYFACAGIPALFFAESCAAFYLIRKKVSGSVFAVLATLLSLSVAGTAIQYFFFPAILLSNTFLLISLVICLFALVSPDYAELTKKQKELYGLQQRLEEEAARESEKIHKRDKQKEILFGQIIDVLAKTIDAGDPNRKGHSENVANMTARIAQKLLPLKTDWQKAYHAAILHDIGIIGISEDVAAKKGKMTDEEFEEVKRHSEIGERILSTIVEMPEMAKIVRAHHERFDGKGYPDGLKGNDIPLAARIIMVADAYDAMTHERSYKELMSKEEAMEELKRMAGSQFDPEVVEAALEVISE